MKKIILLFTCLSISFLLINSCKKKDINGFEGGEGLIPGSYITLDSLISESLDFSNQAATVSIIVSQHGTKEITSINVYVATGSNANDPSTWVLLKNVPYAKGGVTLSVSTAELNTALAPAVISPGNSYIFQNEVVTSDGMKYSVTNTPTNYVSLPGYNMALTWQATAVCPFDQTAAVGNYKVVSDAFWADFSVGDVVTVTAAPGNQNQLLLLAYPNPNAGGINRVPIVINVDPNTDVATVSKQVVGQYAGWPYGDLSIVTTGSSNFVFSCTGYIGLTFSFTVAAGSFGSGSLILQHE
ncbi:MAG TPA: hypothetical protein VKT28_01010 [Puia sp.]|nr:hypothetical protein [Puia sp.]